MQFNLENTVRVKIGEGRDSLDFKASDDFIIIDAEGRVLLKGCDSKRPWRVKLERNADDSENFRFEVFDAEYRESIHINQNFSIQPAKNEASFTLFDIVIGQGFNWEHRVKRQYQGPIEFFVNSHERIDAVIELPLEDYVRGVVPAEMGFHYPGEALKAQAIVSRTWALKHLKTRHEQACYDFCSDRHCQLFHTRAVHDAGLKKILTETAGQIITASGQLINSEFHTICGGHTEAGDCPGIVDNRNETPKTLKLNDEKAVEKWIKSPPVVFCHLTGVMDHQKLNIAKRYFRWDTVYNRRNLEEIVCEKLNKDIGTLYGIQVTDRSKTGRVREVELLCSHENFKIEGEMQVRRLLSEKALNSSLFVIHTEFDQDGIPIDFTISGAGSGHGRGLCQTGAAVMAIENYSNKDIIAHYFPKTKIETLT